MATALEVHQEGLENAKRSIAAVSRLMDMSDEIVGRAAGCSRSTAQSSLKGRRLWTEAQIAAFSDYVAIPVEVLKRPASEAVAWAMEHCDLVRAQFRWTTSELLAA